MDASILEGLDSVELRRIVSERNFFKFLFDSMPFLVIVKSARPETSGQYLIWNRAAEEWLGVAEREVLGRTDVDFFSSEEAVAFQERDLQVFASRHPLRIAEEIVPSRTRGQLRLRTVRTPIFDENGRPLAMLVVSEDITERVAVEQRLRETLDALERERNLLKVLLDNVPAGIFAKSAQIEDFGRYLIWNQFMETLHGIPVTDARGTTAGEIFESEFSLAVEEQDRQIVLQRRAIDFPPERIHTNRGERYLRIVKAPVLDAAGQVNAIVGCSIDITGQMHAEAEQRRLTDILKQITEHFPGAVYQVRAEQDGTATFLHVGEGIREIFGLSPADFYRDAALLFRVVHPDDLERFEESQNVARVGNLPWQCEFRVQHADGAIRWVHGSSVPTVEPDGATVWNGFYTDISERKDFERTLMAAKDAAEAASRAKSDFLAMMSHEIRTPLNGVLGFADVLADTGLTPEQRDLVATIQESGGSLLRILNESLDYSKIESGKLGIERRPGSLRAVVQSATEAFRGQASRKGIQLSWVVDEAVPERVLLDSGRLGQILINLVSNAVKFTNSGGVQVSVTARPLPERKTALVRFAIRDSGIGISEKDIERLFAPFQQLDASMSRRYGGTGLGLTIVQRLTGLMGGTVAVDSLPGVGATFVVDLPIECAPASDAVPEIRTPVVAPTEFASNHPLAILIVEDNPTNLRLARLILERLGYRPDEARDGPSAVERAATRPYDIILMDIQMPGMDGYEAARRIRASGNTRTEIVALTAHAMDSDRENSATAGMTGHLTKPINSRELCAVLERIALGRKRESAA